ncbi:MAG: GNAT family N-acetyltransferase [Succinivibrio sp.]
MIIHDEKSCTFSLTEDGFKAFLCYEIKEGVLDVTTTQVPKAISGRGIASKLMSECHAYVKAQNLSLKDPLSCSYAQAYIERHK